MGGASLLGLVLASALIAFGYWISESKKPSPLEALKAERRDKITTWRGMIASVQREIASVDKSRNMAAIRALERRQDFLQFRPLASENTNEALADEGEKYPERFTSLPPALHFIAEDLDRLEREWKLLP